MPIWQLCANLLIPNCLRSNLSYSPLAALELYVNVKNHKEFRNITWNDVIKSNKRPKSTPEAIKCYIEDNYYSFEKEWLQKFKPILNKLLDVFDLN